ncbi:hypothetical protein M422DRAFT_66121 [Sphaerobolus stellatus SS14]|nr:hypothetical protein M422DRAFT_66121 [Sphaerobolus stellatus SS14]
MADTKKRPLEDGHETGISKKRAVSSSTDSPVPVNGKMGAGYEDLSEMNLEKFRKEAIYRRMKQHSRENERAQEQIAWLERKREMLQANIAAINACWEQLVSEVRSLLQSSPAGDGVKREESDNAVSRIAGSPELELSSELLAKSLEERSKSTRDLIATLLTSKIPSPDNEDLHRQCSNLREEVAALRADVSLANTRMSEVEEEREQYHTKLLSAEAQIDRLKGISAQAQREASTGPPKSTVKQETKDVIMGSTTPETTKGESLTNGYIPPIISDEDQTWKALYESSSKNNTSLLNEIEQLKSRCNTLESELASPNVETLKKSPFYEATLSKLHSYKNQSDTNIKKWYGLTLEVNSLKSEREDFKEKLIADYNVKYDEQKNLLVKRDHENVRLREQRDALQAEIAEVKARTTEKKSTAQLQILLDSRGDRIAALELEVKRLKSELAANTGNEQLLDLILGDQLATLPERLQSTEKKLEALQSSLNNLDKERPDIAKHIRSEVEARESLNAALRRLERFEKTFGPASTLPPDQQTLAKKLQERTEQLEQSHLKHKQELEAANGLYSEIEKLSAAWDSLDRQNKAKVFDMESMEAKIQKLAAEKAKADNKYFGAMRQKEAAEAERKASARAVEKLQKAVEKYTEAEKTAAAKMATQEQEIQGQKARGNLEAERVRDLERELQELRWNHQAEQKQVEELKRQLTDTLALEKQHRSDARRYEEESIRARKEVERTAAKAVVSVPSGKTSSRETELEEKYQKCMKLLRCSTCHQNLRSHVLTKCMHTFCKDCVQARIDTRQRKCPACNMGFSMGEFQQLYFQG